MTKNKDIKISNCIFDLTIHWSPLALGAQVSLFIASIAVLLFAQEDVVRRVLLVILLIDIAAILFAALKTSTLEIVDVAGDESETPAAKPAKKSGSGTINNKVPINSPTKTQQQRKMETGDAVKTNQQLREKREQEAKAAQPEPQPQPEPSPRPQPRPMPEPRPRPEPRPMPEPRPRPQPRPMDADSEDYLFKGRRAEPEQAPTPTVTEKDVASMSLDEWQKILRGM